MKFPDLPRTGQSVAFSIKQIIDYLRASRIVSINGIKGVESSNGTAFNIPIPKQGKDTVNLSPLEVTIFKDGDDFKIIAEPAFIVPRHNESAATGEPIAITSIPASGTPMTVSDGDKVYVKITVNEYGRATAGVFEKSTSWPDDVMPELIGGDDTSGTAGNRYYRIANFDASGESIIKTQILTGHIDHFQPTLAENLTTSPSTGEARLLQKWNATEGRWDFRYLKSGDGITISEDGDFITVAGSHPWQATANGANIDIAPGKMFYPSPKGSTPEDVTPIIYDYVSYAGGSVTPTGSGWIYAKGEVAGVVTVGGQEFLDIMRSSSGDFNSVLLEVRTLTSLGIVFSEYGPSAFDPADGNIYFPIAEVSSSGGSASVIDQILTHNPHDSLHQITFS